MRAPQAVEPIDTQNILDVTAVPRSKWPTIRTGIEFPDDAAYSSDGLLESTVVKGNQVFPANYSMACTLAI
jgi:hypothetical protein